MNDFTALVAIASAVVVYLISMLVVQRVSLHKKRALLLKYGELRRQSLALQDVVGNYLLVYNADRKLMQGGISFAEFYRQLKSNHVSNLSDKYISKMKNTNNLVFLNKAEKKMHEQELRLKDAEQLVSGMIAA